MISPVIGELGVVWSKNVINEVLFETGEMRHKLNLSQNKKMGQ